MKEILLKIESETELVQKDNLAKGTLIDPTFIYSLPRERSENNKVLWTNFDALKCGISESDPPEYWGDFPTYITDFIAGAQQYPWMPSEISKAEFPF